MTKLEEARIVFVGAGNMAEALVRGLLASQSTSTPWFPSSCCASSRG